MILNNKANGIWMAAGLAFGLTSCGLLQNSDDDAPRGTNSADPGRNFSLVGEEHSEMKGPDVKAYVNGLMLVRKFDLNSVKLQLNSIAKAMSEYSRDAGRDAKVAACIQDHINNTPLRVTTDTLAFTLDLNVVESCDRPARDEDLIVDLKNEIHIDVMFGCSGDSLLSLAGKYVSDLKSVNVICDLNQSSPATSRKFKAEMKLDARRATKIKNGTEYEVNHVNRTLYRGSLMSANGSPCNETVLDPTKTKMDLCEESSESLSYSGHPRYETNKANEKIDPHPTVVKRQFTISEGILEKGATYYSSVKDMKFWFNGWTGAFTTKNGWSAPTWKATLGGSEIGGVYGDKSAPSANSTADTNSHGSEDTQDSDTTKPIVDPAPASTEAVHPHGE
jgi:hypothetical protein